MKQDSTCASFPPCPKVYSINPLVGYVECSAIKSHAVYAEDWLPVERFSYVRVRTEKSKPI